MPTRAVISQTMRQDRHRLAGASIARPDVIIATAARSAWAAAMSSGPDSRAPPMKDGLLASTLMAIRALTLHCAQWCDRAFPFRLNWRLQSPVLSRFLRHRQRTGRRFTRKRIPDRRPTPLQSGSIPSALISSITA